jgi:hypothetical protein
MAAKSKKQRRLMGAVLSIKRGDYSGDTTTGFYKFVKNLADNMSEDQLIDFASTKDKGLPEDVNESTVAYDVAVSNEPLGKIKNRKRKMKWNEIVKEEQEKVPTGNFSGSRRGDTWTYYGMGGQQIVFMFIPKFDTNPFPEKMTAEELIKLKDKVKKWSYYPKGKLF